MIGWASSIWLILTNCFFFFPTSFDENMQQTPEDFNYTCVVFGATFIVAGIYWFFPVYGARYHFKGPKRPDEEDEAEDNDTAAKKSEGKHADVKLANKHHANH